MQVDRSLKIKALIQPKIKIIPWFTHPQGILGLYDFLISEESNRSYVKYCPGSSKLCNGSGWVFSFNSPKISSFHP